MSDNQSPPEPDRPERAARAYFADQSREADFAPLDPVDVVGRSSRRRWTGIGVAAAACLAIALVVPLALRGWLPGAPITATPEPEPGFAWTETAAPPLSPRFGAVTAWIDGAFFILGGWEGRPCPPGAMCDMAPPTLLDGARYDPATDAWTSLAALPVGMGEGYADSAVADGRLYVMSYVGDGSLLAYDPGVDSWRKLETPAAFGRLVGLDDSLAMVVGGGPSVGYDYHPDSDTWSPWEAGPLDSCLDFQGFGAGDRVVVLAGCSEDPGADRRVGSYDPADGTWTAAVPLDAAVEGEAVYAAGHLVWPDALTPVSSSHSEGILDIADGSWQQVDIAQPSGPLGYPEVVGSTPHLALAQEGLVAANGRLLDVTTAAWVDVPDLARNERWDPVVVAAPSSLLSCFGYEYADADRQAGHQGQDCQLLAREASGDPDPTVAPVPEATDPGPAWDEVLAGTDPIPTDPLLVSANGQYYLMGGYLRGDGGDDVQLYTGSRFDPAADRWLPIASLPEVPVSRPYTMAADVVGDIVYVHFSFEESGELWGYDTVADAWHEVTRTDETEHYLGTEDGLARFRMLGEGASAPAPQLLTTRGWEDLPSPPVVPEPSATVLRLGDHSLGLVSGGRLSVLDTRTRSWGEPSEPGDVADRRPFGAGGAAVFVRTPGTAGEPSSDDKDGLDVVTYRDGGWEHPAAPVADGGLGSYTGEGGGPWVVVAGNLFEAATGQWRLLPALPGGSGWESRIVAASTDSVMTCFPSRADGEQTTTADGCYLLTLR
ncbi:MAG: hypothetical protein AAGC63_16710 [Propionicimonas sp.]|nr:hypothetical protein [Propionicimonas sp.]